MTSPPVAARGDFFRLWEPQILIYVLNKIGVRETHILQEVTVWDR
jgi:hypothetical protein